MELNFFNKLINTFSQPISANLSSTFKIDKKKLLTDSNNTLYHTDCKYTKKKVCQCKLTYPATSKVKDS
jgi:hypothetical protein